MPKKQHTISPEEYFKKSIIDSSNPIKQFQRSIPIYRWCLCNIGNPIVEILWLFISTMGFPILIRHIYIYVCTYIRTYVRMYVVSETLWVPILHSAEAEEDNLSSFDSKIACLCQSIEINNKYVCMYINYIYIHIYWIRVLTLFTS